MSRIVETPVLIESLIERLGDGYVFPGRSARAEQLLRTRLEQGAYDGAAGPGLCELVSADLFEATNDKHLRLLWHEPAEAPRDEAQLVAELREAFRLDNQGVRRVERLAGNIGVIELTIIGEASRAGPALAAAMELIHHTHTLIIDLRGTRGGSPDGVAFLASFFFPDGNVHLNDIVEGPHGRTRQYWASAYLPGPRYLGRPVYVLTSADTFSGGESLAYDLQALGRATIVGETTRGGAHPSEVVSLTDQIELRLPVARAVSPVTGSNWEGAGVQPDVPVPASDALGVARRTALETIVNDEAVPTASRTEARLFLDRLSEAAAT
jgi:C-terminal processing protease CtpA/Prc